MKQLPAAEFELEDLLREAPAAPSLFQSLVEAGSDAAVERARADGAAAEDRLYEHALTVVEDALKAPMIDPESDKWPPGWLEQHGGDKRRAKRAWRTARAAWSSKQATFIKVASEQLAALTKAKATRGSVRTLNVQFVQVPVASHTFPEIVLEPEAKDRR